MKGPEGMGGMINKQRERSEVPATHVQNDYPELQGFSSINMPITRHVLIRYKKLPYLQQLVAENPLEYPKSGKRTIPSGTVPEYRRSTGAGTILEQWTLSMSRMDEWLNETGKVTSAVAQLRGMVDMGHPVIDQHTLVGGGSG